MTGLIIRSLRDLMDYMLMNDVHFDGKKSSMNFLEYQKNWLKTVAFKAAQEQGVKKLVIAGDLFDNRTQVNIKVLQDVLTLLKESHFEKIFICAGNHDLYYRSTSSYSILKVLAAACDKTVLVIDDCLVEDDLLMIPWINTGNVDRVLATLRSIEYIPEIVLHYEGGDTEVDEELYRLKNNQCNIMSGHYHYRGEHGPVFMNGAPFRITIADVEEAQGVSIVKQRKTTFIENNDHYIVDVCSKEELYAIDPSDVKDRIVRFTSSVDITDEDYKKMSVYRELAHQFSLFLAPKSDIVQHQGDQTDGTDRKSIDTYVNDILSKEDPEVKTRVQTLLKGAEV